MKRNMEEPTADLGTIRGDSHGTESEPAKTHQNEPGGPDLRPEEPLLSEGADTSDTTDPEEQAGCCLRDIPDDPPRGMPSGTAHSEPHGSAEDIPDEPDLDPEVWSGLEDLIGQLNNALKLRSFYPKGHSAVAPPLAKFGTLLDSTLNDMGEITIGSTGDTLLFRGRSFGEGKRPLRSFAKHLKLRNLTGIIFRPGVTEEEVENLLEILSMDPEDFASADSPLHDTESIMPHIELRWIDYGSALRHVSDEEMLSGIDNPRDMWKALVTHHLLSDGDELSDEARELIVRSSGDTAALEEMTSELVRACSDSAGDPNAEVARGLAKTCKGMEGLEGTRLDRGMSNLAEIVAKMDPEVMARLAETEVTHGRTGDDLIQKMTDNLPPNAKLRLLSALVDSQRLNKSRLSSVFRRVAGARSRRRELLEELEREMSEGDPSETEQFERVYEAVEDLVLTESEGRFLGSDYVSMLQEIGEASLDPEDEDSEGIEVLKEAIRTLDPHRRLEFKGRFLVDLLRVHEDPGESARTLDDIKEACEELNKAGNSDLPAELVSDLAEDLSEGAAPDPERRALLRDCLKTMAAGEYAEPAIKRLILGGKKTAGSLKAMLQAFGAEVCPSVWSVVAGSDEAAQNPEVIRYLASHSERASEASKDFLLSNPVRKRRRVLKVLSLLCTPEAVEAMIWALHNCEGGAQREIVNALASSHAPAARNAIERLMAGTNRHLALLATASLGEARAQHAVPILLESLRKQDLFGRRISEARQAAVALGKIGSSDAVPHLEKLLTRRFLAFSDAKPALRRDVASALRDIGGDEALLVLQRNTSGYNRQVREACTWALSRPQRPSPEGATDLQDPSDTDLDRVIDDGVNQDGKGEFPP